MDIDLTYLIREKDRHGNVRFYYRRKPGKRVRIREEPGTPAFARAYLAASEGKEASVARPAAISKGSLREAMGRYMGSPEFKALDTQTQYVRRLLLDRISADRPKDKPKVPTYGEWPAARFEARHIRQMRDDHAEKPEGANGRVKALRQVFAYAIEADIAGVKSNPARDVRYLKPKGDGFHSWTIEEVEKFEERHPVGTMARLALAVLLYTGQRRSDAVLFGPAMVRDGWLTFTQRKNRNSKPVLLSLPIVPALAKAVTDTPGTGAKTWIATTRGKPFTAESFGNWFRDRCEEAEVPGRAHGLRKAAASRLAELGCSDREIMAITGHTTSKEVDRYTRSARQKVLARSAMDKVEGVSRPHLTVVAGRTEETAGRTAA